MTDGRTDRQTGVASPRKHAIVRDVDSSTFEKIVRMRGVGLHVDTTAYSISVSFSVLFDRLS